MRTAGIEKSGVQRQVIMKLDMDIGAMCCMSAATMYCLKTNRKDLCNQSSFLLVTCTRSSW